ncbi:MAG: hypothetical protein COY40_00880 [Alphaproteobacteria bacterium CG_4_10_14_0_8_um_filter_53_9]|nr:MAG: hypothetical protein COY40_00880 [Alphaproteobacteria bacterium CG_4_10_14_0_8_um_filter_53_9]
MSPNNKITITECGTRVIKVEHRDYGRLAMSLRPKEGGFLICAAVTPQSRPAQTQQTGIVKTVDAAFAAAENLFSKAERVDSRLYALMLAAARQAYMAEHAVEA